MVYYIIKYQDGKIEKFETRETIMASLNISMRDFTTLVKAAELESKYNFKIQKCLFDGESKQKKTAKTYRLRTVDGRVDKLVVGLNDLAREMKCCVITARRIASGIRTRSSHLYKIEEIPKDKIESVKEEMTNNGKKEESKD